jgi:uncharacterized damage-inducible protein DinB
MKMVITLILALIMGMHSVSDLHSVQNTSSFNEEVIREIDGSAAKLLSLAEAIPEENYNWRPDAGVRSIYEVFAHIAAANYNLPAMMGAEIPDDLNPRGFEEAGMPKEELLDVLNQSFQHLKSVIENVDVNDLNNETSWFGGSTNTVRGVMLAITRHMGEHQGQLIAYSRMNNITPPWSQ